MPSSKRKVGNVCETIAVKHIVKHGFVVLERNYLRKWGEIDIVAISRNPSELHFIEVKGQVTRENTLIDYLPEENVHSWKKRRLWRAIQTWLAEHSKFEDYDWQVDVMAVFLDLEAKKAKIRWTKNIILSE
ncbi:YraN family protein [Candidatus Giovannonibacteria bacterium]|nr:YraN family protein [Candidatus Giovannonibacteria bacterium]